MSFLFALKKRSEEYYRPINQIDWIRSYNCMLKYSKIDCIVRFITLIKRWSKRGRIILSNVKLFNRQCLFKKKSSLFHT